MSDPNNNDVNKGFKGLQDLASKMPDERAHKPDATHVNSIDISSSQASNVTQNADIHPQSKTATPESRKYIIGSLIISVVLLLSYCMHNKSVEDNSYAMPEASASAFPDSVDDATPEATSVQTAPWNEIYEDSGITESEPVDSGPSDSLQSDSSYNRESMPPVGSGRILISSQIRYCVFEDRRLKAAQAVVDNYSDTSVNTFNAMAEDYNSRCGYYKYSVGALAPILNEANLIQDQLEIEGRKRMGM